MNIEIVPNLNSGEEEEGSNLNESPHHHEGTTAVIENIDSITNNNNNDASSNNNDEDGGILSAAISDDTSATSIASDISDGNPRPRSESLHITPSNHNNNGDHRPSSIPRLRPRSNPRTRTPMRHESPLLVISPIVVAAGTRAIIAENNGIANERSGSEATAQLEDGDSNTNEPLIRNIFHTRSSRARRLRAGSIPEEIVEDDGSAIVVDDNTSLVAANNDNVAAGNQAINESTTTTSAAAVPNNNTTTRTAGRFFTQAVAPTSTLRRRNNNRTTESNTTQQQRTLSTKQNPSHRKIRRWKNDAFIGTPSEHVHTMLMTKGGEDQGWNEFPYMPNHPLEYNSEFSKLSVDRSRGGEKVRERFVRGEVASGDFAVKKKNGSGVDEEVGEEVMMQRRIVTKCRQLGIPSKVIMDESKWGEVLYEKLGLRIQSILSRSCSSVDTNASRIVCTFESYLVSLALHSKVTGNDDDDDDVALGFPPLQPQAVYDVFQDILAGPPRIVMRNKQSSSSSNNKQRIGKAASAAAKEVSDMNKCGVLIPTTHFYFPTEGQDGSSRRSSAFHRILLYAVCQFHGLETSSSVVPDKKLKRDNGRRKGQQKQNRDVKGSMKVVTVQSSVLLAPSIKLLDFVCT